MGELMDHPLFKDIDAYLDERRDSGICSPYDGSLFIPGLEMPFSVIAVCTWEAAAATAPHRNVGHQGFRGFAMKRTFLFVALILVAVYPAGAQSNPSFAVDATTGAGQGNGGEFFDRGIGGVRLAVSVSGTRDARLSPYVEIAKDWLALGMDHILICYPSTRGGCIKPYPDLRGIELILGGLLRPTPRVELRAGVGGGAFEASEGPRVGGIVGQADATVRVSNHIGVLLGTRYVVLPRYIGDRLWTMPWAFGLRVRW